MPHIFFELQGEQVLREDHTLALATPGTLSPEEYDNAVRDVVGFLTWASDTKAAVREKLGIAVLVFLGVLFVFAYLLKKEYWKDVH
jgi:ubiquinol-cytochrome c reductase cytochrome c1 subunit